MLDGRRRRGAGAASLTTCFGSGEARSGVARGVVSDAVHADVFDAGRVEEHVVVVAHPRRDSAQVAAVVAVAHRRPVEAQGPVAAVLVHPVGHRVAVAVAQGVNHRSDAGQVVAPRPEAVVPAPPARRGGDHRFAQSRQARPVLAQLHQLHDAAPAVVAGHPPGNIRRGDSRLGGLPPADVVVDARPLCWVSILVRGLWGHRIQSYTPTPGVGSARESSDRGGNTLEGALRPRRGLQPHM